MSATSSNLVIASSSVSRTCVGVDLAKNVFQVAYETVDEAQAKTVKINRQLTRNKFTEFLQINQGKLIVGMEACGSAHYWGRVCQSLGHEVRIIPAQCVKFMNIGNKDDKNDAYCIWQSMQTPDLKTIRIRTEENQAQLALLKLRDLVIKQKTQLANNLRAALYEMGITAAQGNGKLEVKAREVAQQCLQERKEGSELIATIIDTSLDFLESQAKQLQTIDEYITNFTQNNESCRRLMTIPFIGPINAFTLLAEMGSPHDFKNARSFADYIGFAPAHTGTGGKKVMLGISKKGSPIAKRVLYQAALCLYVSTRDRDLKAIAMIPKTKDDNTVACYWVTRLGMNKPLKKTVCACANKLCRIAWAVLKSGQEFDHSKVALTYPLKGIKHPTTRHVKHGDIVASLYEIPEII